MEIKKTYIAFDGEEFETEEECLEYEDCAKPEGAVRFFDEEGREIFDDDSAACFERAYYIYIVNAAKAEQYLDWVRDYSGYEIPEEIKDNHIYAYDDRSYDYYDLTDRAYEIMRKRDFILHAISQQTEPEEELRVYTKVTEGMPTEFGYGPEWVLTAMFMDDYPKFYTQEEAIDYWNNVLSKECLHD